MTPLWILWLFYQYSRGIVGQVARTGIPIRIRNGALKDKRYEPEVDSPNIGDDVVVARYIHKNL